jgi:hypothetical protein
VEGVALDKHVANDSGERIIRSEYLLKICPLVMVEFRNEEPTFLAQADV